MPAIIKILFHSVDNPGRIISLLFHLVFLFILSSLNLLAEEINLRPARQIADSVLQTGFEDILSQSGLKSGDTVTIKDINNGTNIYIIFKLESFLQQKGIIINKNPGKEYPEFRTLVENFGFEYKNTDNSEYAIRMFELDLSFSSAEDSDIKRIRRISTDTIPRLFYFQERHSQHPYSNGKLPEPDGSWWDKIAEPAVVISTAVISVLILFSVRSK